MAIDTPKPVLDAFEKEYPFIKTELVRAGEEQLVNRILSETRAGRWSFDALSTSSIADDRAQDHRALSSAGARSVHGSIQRSAGLLDRRFRQQSGARLQHQDARRQRRAARLRRSAPAQMEGQMLMDSTDCDQSHWKLLRQKDLEFNLQQNQCTSNTFH